MSGSDRDVERAKQAALIARARLADTMGEIQNRFHPRTLLNDAWQEVRERGHEFAEDAVNVARAKPVQASAIVAAVIALFAREPIRHALATLLRHRRETPGAGEMLKSRQASPSPLEGETAQRYEEIA